jgi:hypothetical protein
VVKQVLIGFNPQGVIVPIASLLPLKQLKPALKNSHKYQKVL